MHYNYDFIEKCLLCSSQIIQFLDFGRTPLANSFTKEYYEQEPYPLTLMRCIKCNHIQLSIAVHKEVLYKNYIYASGTSIQNQNHFKSYADEIIQEFFPHTINNELPGRPEDLILDIGSNDGTFLKYFNGKGIRRLGIDPAANIAIEAEKDNVKNIVGFFTHEWALSQTGNDPNYHHITPFNKPIVITCNNMFAHNKDLEDIVMGVKELLHPNGSFIIENSYLLKIIEQSTFDQVYHEHIHHHHLKALISFFDRLDMKVYDAKEVENHGGSIRVYICHKNNKNRELSEQAKNIIKNEENINEKLDNLKNDIYSKMLKLGLSLKIIKKKNKKISIFGYPAKTTTLLYILFNHCDKNEVNIDIFDSIYDDAVLKQGTYPPNVKLKIKHPSEINKDNPDLLFIGAWNFADNIISKCRANGYDGEFLVPLSKLKDDMNGIMNYSNELTAIFSSLSEQYFFMKDPKCIRVKQIWSLFSQLFLLLEEEGFVFNKSLFDELKNIADDRYKMYDWFSMVFVPEIMWNDRLYKSYHNEIDNIIMLFKKIK